MNRMKNTPEMKIGIVAVSRDCFPAPLSKNRKFIQDMARTEPEGYTHFSETLEYACKMVEKYQGSGKEINIE